VNAVALEHAIWTDPIQLVAPLALYRDHSANATTPLHCPATEPDSAIIPA